MKSKKKSEAHHAKFHNKNETKFRGGDIKILFKKILNTFDKFSFPIKKLPLVIKKDFYSSLAK